MRLLDEQYTRTPFYGVLRMTAWLQRQGYAVNEKRVRRLLRTMELMAIYPSPKTSQPAPSHQIYPYLLRGVAITRPNFVWSTDITYIRLAHGFVYLVAIMDWFSRYVLAWRLSNSLETHFCSEALDQALAHTAPEIFNTDQGAQFTSLEFTRRLDQKGVRISMDTTTPAATADETTLPAIQDDLAQHGLLPSTQLVDAGSIDAGSIDAGSIDAGSIDAGSIDAERLATSRTQFGIDLVGPTRGD